MIFKIIIATSSLTPGIVVNSWYTPSALIENTAAPGNEEINTRLNALPKVIPKPLSSGSRTNLP